MPNTTLYAQSTWKPKVWSDLPSNPEVPRVTLPDGSVAEAVAGLLYLWDPVSASFVKAQADHVTGALQFTQTITKTLKNAVINRTTTGTVVNAVSTKLLKVYAVEFTTSAALTVNFRDGASTALEGPQPIVANGGYSQAVTPPAFLFATSAGNSLDIVISGAGTVAGRLSYYDDDTT